MSGSTPTKYVKGGCSQSTPSPKCMKMIFTKMKDKFDTLRVEVNELMKRFLSLVDKKLLWQLSWMMNHSLLVMTFFVMLRKR
ncbi:hypothetical protein Syun_029086 [Stephania yunnanensis]|uniref:Uncharacterized protein n=1 Tax=Stephania yunnanensis TaxID=152371 RepID=A0AAP0E8A8_9MAGN